jgi:hypothetical protein
VLAADDIRRIMLFANGRGAVTVAEFRIEPAAHLPEGVVALSFGRADAPLFSGFERVAPGDARIEQGHPAAVLRPGFDPLISSGLRGVEKIRVPWQQLRARVSLWTEDVGEWETLPFALERRIRINGTDIASHRLTPAQWIANRYLAGRDREAEKNSDSWQTYGRHRGGLITADVDTHDGNIVIEFAGDSPVATFVSAVLIEPAGQRASLDAVEKARAAWFRAAWPIAAATGEDQDGPVIELNEHTKAQPQTVSLAPGTGAPFVFSIRPDFDAPHPAVAVVAPISNGKTLELTLRAAQWRLERRSTGGNILLRRADMLRGDASALPMRNGEARPFVGWVSAPSDAPPGTYRGQVTVSAAGRTLDVPVTVDVVNVRLPDAPRPAGFYLDEAPHLTWFPDQAAARRSQIACDMATLAQFGVFGNAPPLTTPIADRKAGFIADSRIALQYATAAPWLAYTPLKRILAEVGRKAAVGVVTEAQHNLSAQGLPAPIWSLADEPSNPDQNAMLLGGLGGDLRAAIPGIRLAGQINNPTDRKYLKLFDTVLINDGFGLDRNIVKELQQRGLEVWLYNTGRPRFSAGFWLWHTQASRYLQWHARMPTADPFDPTDGREGDVQIFPPAATPCPEHPDFHRDLIAMANGTVDQRWLAWLDRRDEPAALKLKADLSAWLNRPWKELYLTTGTEMDAWRGRIVELARTLK